MIHKNLLVLGLMALMTIPSFAQKAKKVNPKHINIFKDASAETKNVKIEGVDAVAMMEFTKFKIRLTNTSNDYIIYKPQESNFKLGGKDVKPADKKAIVIKPLDKESRVIDMKAPAKDAHVDAFQYQIESLYKISPNVPATEAPNFVLPATVNTFKAGNFNVEMVNLKKETGGTAVKFKVSYTGEGVGIVDASNLSAKGTNHKKKDQELTVVNDNKASTIILYKGESDTFTATFHMEGRIVDLQLANMELMFKDTFKESKLEKIDGATLDFALDPALTEAKNK